MVEYSGICVKGLLIYFQFNSTELIKWVLTYIIIIARYIFLTVMAYI